MKLIIAILIPSDIFANPNPFPAKLIYGVSAVVAFPIHPSWPSSSPTRSHCPCSSLVTHFADPTKKAWIRFFECQAFVDFFPPCPTPL
jgi:hypothetical protein